MNIKTIVQDILYTILAFALTGMAIESKLQPLISARAFAIVAVSLLGAMQLVYFADVIFGFQQPNVPTPPPAPAVTPTPNA